MAKGMISNFDAYINNAGLDPKPHQREGVEWALARENDPNPPGGVHGGLIADEMGLGKTIVMMGLIVSNFLPKTLIVLPLALLEQWASEIERTMHHTPLIWHGANKGTISDETLASAPIVLTTYGHISKPKIDNDKKSAIHSIAWDRVIFDEAHHLRNRFTQIHRGAIAIRATNRWLITGTPIQNRIQDFYALCAAMGMEEKFYSDRENLGVIGGTFMLKRTKADVGISLPPLKQHEIGVAWANKDEQRLAEDIHSMLQFSNVSTRQADNMIASMDHGMLALLVRARQSCVYPQLIAEQVKKFVEIGLLEDSKSFERATSHSSKLDAVQKLISERKNGRSKIIFCHYRGEIDELTRRLTEEKMTVETLDGRTSATKRKDILSSKPDVLILQIQTGCEGLNLQQFNEIYFVSPHWNPAIEDQAVARAHRIGQKESVDVFRFIMDGFDEEVETKTLDIYSQNVQKAKRRAMRFVDGEVGEKDDADERDDANHEKTKEGYRKDGFVID